MAILLPFSDLTITRALVMISAIALIVVSALGLWSGGSTAHMVVNAVILVFSVLGLCGAMMSDIRWLQAYLLLTIALCLWELIYIIVSAVKYKESVRSLGWDIALCCLLALVSYTFYQSNHISAL